MDSLYKIKDLNKKINDLKLLLEDFINLHSAKKNKILNLETDIKDIKIKMLKHIDELENLINQK